MSTAVSRGRVSRCDLGEEEPALQRGEQRHGEVVGVDGGREVPGGLEAAQSVADGGRPRAKPAAMRARASGSVSASCPPSDRAGSRPCRPGVLPAAMTMSRQAWSPSVVPRSACSWLPTMTVRLVVDDGLHELVLAGEVMGQLRAADLGRRPDVLERGAWRRPARGSARRPPRRSGRGSARPWGSAWAGVCVVVRHVRDDSNFLGLTTHSFSGIVGYVNPFIEREDSRHDSRNDGREGRRRSRAPAHPAGGARPRASAQSGQGEVAGRRGCRDRRWRPGRPGQHRRGDGGRHGRRSGQPGRPRAGAKRRRAAPPGPASGTSSRPAARRRPTRPSRGGGGRPRSRPAWRSPACPTRCCGPTPTCRTSWRLRPRSPERAASAPRQARAALAWSTPATWERSPPQIAGLARSHAGKTYWLTGPELVSNYEVAAVLTELLGRAITYAELSFDENRDAMIRAGVPSRSPR